MHRTEISPLFPALMPTGDDPDLDRLFRPSRHFSSPGQVVASKELSIARKRAILSSWASDACAVESCPVLRRPPGAAAAFAFDDIIDALRQLDGLPDEQEADADAGGETHTGRQNA